MLSQVDKMWSPHRWRRCYDIAIEQSGSADLFGDGNDACGGVQQVRVGRGRSGRGTRTRRDEIPTAQGGLGDCYLVGSLSVIARHWELVHALFPALSPTVARRDFHHVHDPTPPGADGIGHVATYVWGETTCPALPRGSAQASTWHGIYAVRPTPLPRSGSCTAAAHPARRSNYSAMGRGGWRSWTTGSPALRLAAPCTAGRRGRGLCCGAGAGEVHILSAQHSPSVQACACGEGLREAGGRVRGHRRGAGKRGARRSDGRCAPRTAPVLRALGRRGGALGRGATARR